MLGKKSSVKLLEKELARVGMRTVLRATFEQVSERRFSEFIRPCVHSAGSRRLASRTSLQLPAQPYPIDMLIHLLGAGRCKSQMRCGTLRQQHLRALIHRMHKNTRSRTDAGQNTPMGTRVVTRYTRALARRTVASRHCAGAGRHWRRPMFRQAKR